MNSILVTGLKNARDAVVHGATAVINCYVWAGRKVEHYSHKYLPETAAKIVSAVMWTLPYTAAAVFAPTFVFFVSSALLIGFWNGIGRDFDEGMGKEHRQNLFSGIRNGSIIRAAYVINSVAATGASGWLLAIAVQCLFIGLQAHMIAGKDTPPPAEPAVNLA